MLIFVAFIKIITLLYLATTYGDHEYIALEDKLKFLRRKIKLFEKDIMNLKVVKSNMDQAVNKFKNNKNVKNKRVDVIKQQIGIIDYMLWFKHIFIEQTKQQYRAEVEECLKEEQENIKRHQQMENLK